MATKSSSNNTNTTNSKNTNSNININSSSSSSSSSSNRRGPIATAKTIVINRTVPILARDVQDGQALVSRRVTRSVTSSLSAIGQHPDVSNIMTNREKEKRDMQELNARFANYIEKVRFLEAQNKKLSGELQKLKDTWGKETERIKQLYGVELDQLRKLLDEAEKHKAAGEVRVSSLEDQVNELQILLDEANRQHQSDVGAIEKLNKQMAELEGEIALLRRRVANFDTERARDLNEIKRLKHDNARLRQDLDSETLNHINAENEAQSLREELQFLKEVHESELKELASLAYRDTTSENREFWKNEMAQALNEIQVEYDSKVDVIRNELESQYTIKMQEFKTNNTRDSMELTQLREENKRIKALANDTRGKLPELEARNKQLERELEQVKRDMEEAERDCEMQKSQLRTNLANTNATLEEYLRELQTLMDAKLSLELEILAYRKLLEGEEIRIKQTSVAKESVTETSSTVEQSSLSVEQRQQLPLEQQQQQQLLQTQQQAKQQMSLLKGEMSAKTTYQRTAKGNLSIQECSPDGRYILIENTGKKGRREDLGEWKVTRNIDNGKQIVKFTIPRGTFVDEGAGKALKIWAKGQKPLGSVRDLETNDHSWGVGSNIVTTLANSDGEERASHTQKTTYSAS